MLWKNGPETAKFSMQISRFMNNLLRKHNIEFVEIKRKEYADSPISASGVRMLLQEGNLEEAKNLMPETTHDYLQIRSVVVK